MPQARRLEEVFKTVGLPKYTYVKPTHFGEIRADILQPGLHLLIEGPSGVGKTCVVYKVFEELHWALDADYSYVSCRDDDADAKIDKFLAFAQTGEIPKPPTLVVDDFHFLTEARRARLGSTLKGLSDKVFEQPSPPKVILIGIPTAGASLLGDSHDLLRRLGSYRFTRAADPDIATLISDGENALNVIFDGVDALLSESAGNFWLAQYVCRKVCAMADVHTSQDEVQILAVDLMRIRDRLMDELNALYLPVAKTFAKGKKWRPGGNKPYLDVLLALAALPDSVVTFDMILQQVPERRRPGIKTVRVRIPEVIYDPAKEIDLRRHLAFDPDSGFSIEDPLFRYFLSHLDQQALLRELGVTLERIERARIYTYDIGFSFAGEARALIEAVNDELKSNDVVTFYDFDQQAVLLALDLEEVLAKIYSETCRYYLVFLDKHYQEKVWTKYEKDVMTHSKRRGHIIPVILDDTGATGAVGIASTIGRIDLRKEWATISTSEEVPRSVRTELLKRCVIPVLEKLDEQDGSVRTP